MATSFNVMALDADYQIVQLLRYSNLQWTRKYHESGYFSLTIPVGQYLSNMVYIYTKDRPELGRISQVNYLTENGSTFVALSGYFLEYDLNRMVCYAKASVTNITNQPSWINQTGKAEDVAFAYFNAFKELKTSSRTSTLNIASGTSQGRGHTADHARNNEYLADKIYKILKPSGMSYRVAYDFQTSKKVFNVWTGLDRTQDNTDGNNQIIFSTKYGNIKNPNILVNKSSWKNCALAYNTYSENNVEKVYVNVGLGDTATTADEDRYYYEQDGSNRSDFASDTEFMSAILNNVTIDMQENYGIETTVEFDSMTGSYEYMTDFDLGDLCSLEIPEMDFSADIRLTGCYEVVKSGKWSLTLEFGEPKIL